MGLYERSISESSDDLHITPIQFGELKRGLEDSEYHVPIWEDASSNRYFSSVMGLKRKKVPVHRCNPSLVKMMWKKLAIKALAQGDPWERFHLGKYPAEKCKRHRYDALRQRWVTDEVMIKMERLPFSNGAMRECFRTKKLSNFARNDDWSKAYNYVAKSYINSSTPRQAYFDDVKLQMDAKLWGEEYNRHNPPKQIDIVQMSVLEMVGREGSPLYHLEHFIEGDYIKYSSNSGFVCSDTLRKTPHSFSHFTFERSGHELIVVDVQGVGDLYTDPQIHTASGTDYGDGNLGTRGMALFFHSHLCNKICKKLELTQFSLTDNEIKTSRKLLINKTARTVVKNDVCEAVLPPTSEERECIRLRSLSSGYMSTEERDRIDSIGSIDSIDTNEDSDSDPEDLVSESASIGSRRRRQRYDSSSDFGENTESKRQAYQDFVNDLRKKSRPSCVMNAMDHQMFLEALAEDGQMTEMEHDVLGRIHLDLAKCHEVKRFVTIEESYDREAALFHLEYAAKCGNLEAVLAMAQIHLDLPHDVLPDFELDEEDKDLDDGFHFLLKAAEMGERSAMILVAKAYDTGNRLPDTKDIDWKFAVFWYSKCLEKALDENTDNYTSTMYDPSYLILARQAEMYLTGGFSLLRDPNKAGELFTEAADEALAANKGKCATKYYMQAEEAWGAEE